MISLKGIKSQVTGVAVTGAIAAFSVLGPNMALADPPNLVPNGSFELASFSETDDPMKPFGAEPTYLPGWTHQARSTDSILIVKTSPHAGPCETLPGLQPVVPSCATDGNNVVMMVASDPANKGWPGIETTDLIPIDPGQEYAFQALFFTFAIEEAGLPWMDITLFDAKGKRLGAVSSGTSKTEKAAGYYDWHEKTYKFKPAALSKYFEDIAGVKLGLRQSLNYGFVGYEKGVVTGVAYDNVTFKTVN